ncbi:MAG: hypothetical protein Q9216_004660 [Gyalolechia sp. 2 TL-2023]
MTPYPKQEPESHPYDSDSSCDPCYPAPSAARLAALHAHKDQQLAQKENHRPAPLHEVPFRTVNWVPKSLAPTSRPGHLQKIVVTPSPGSNQGQTHGHIQHTKHHPPTKSQATPTLPSPPEAATPQRCASHPTTTTTKPKQEPDEQDNTQADLSPRRSSAPFKLQTVQHRRLRKQQKLEWKARLASDLDRYEAEQAELFSSAKARFSPELVVGGVRLKREDE